MALKIELVSSFALRRAEVRTEPEMQIMIMNFVIRKKSCRSGSW